MSTARVVPAPAGGAAVAQGQGARLAIVDYGLANIQSVVNALECFSGAVRVAARGEDLAGADRIVLPGVGHFDEGMRGLKTRGHDKALAQLVLKDRVPIIGICLGFQFLFEGSEEGVEAGLGWIKGRNVRIPDGPGVKVAAYGLERGYAAAFVSSLRPYQAAHRVLLCPFLCCSEHGRRGACAAATCSYGIDFIAAVERDNIFGAQFHPEKSQLAGMKLLETFLAL